MEILRGYSLGKNIQRLIKSFWDEQVVVPKTGRFCGWTFGTERGVNQGDPVSPKIFNIVVNTVVRVVLMEICGMQETQHGLVRAVGEHTIVFYADDGRIEGRKPI